MTSTGKAMTCIFVDAGVLYIDYLDKCYTITEAYYAVLLIKRIRRGNLTRGVFFHQNNTPTHTSTVGTNEIQKCGPQLVEHPPYSSDLVSSDYYLFPKRNKKTTTNKQKTHMSCVRRGLCWIMTQFDFIKLTGSILFHGIINHPPPPPPNTHGR